MGVAVIVVACLIVVAGALAGPGTLLRNLALSVDVFLQSFGWNQVLIITLSSRAGLAARNGNAKWAQVICWLFHNPDHCRGAIQGDITRALDSLQLLFDGEQKADAAIAYLRTLNK